MEATKNIRLKKWDGTFWLFMSMKTMLNKGNSLHILVEIPKEILSVFLKDEQNLLFCQEMSNTTAIPENLSNQTACGASGGIADGVAAKIKRRRASNESLIAKCVILKKYIHNRFNSFGEGM